MWLLIVTEMFSIPCLVNLWRRPDATLVRRIAWSIVLAFPVFGPVFYGGMYDPPPPNTGAGTARPPRYFSPPPPPPPCP